MKPVAGKCLICGAKLLGSDAGVYTEAVTCTPCKDAGRQLPSRTDALIVAQPYFQGPGWVEVEPGIHERQVAGERAA